MTRTHGHAARRDGHAAADVLREAADAIRCLEEGHARGKVVITLDR